ncbi:MAG: S41 family peptidase, partial [Dehalococcoidia bacterium]
ATPEALRDAAIKGIFDSLDPHSSYIDPESYALARDDFEGLGSFEGIGATVSKEGDWVVIAQPLPNTPAERAGVKVGDQVLEVDGQSAEGWSVQLAVTKIRGPIGTSVTIKVRHRDGTVETFKITRDKIAVESVSRLPLLGGVLRDAAGEEVKDLAYVRIRSFSRTTPQELEKALKDVNGSGAKGIILDLRSNPGGLLQETVQVADMFLDKGQIFFQQDRDGAESGAIARPGHSTELPIVILQDEFSASGAELLAGALQENGRAKVVGTRSFGKGTVNHARDLSNGGALYVSIGRWLTPKHNQIEGRGIIPDYEVTMTLEEIEARKDIPAARAIDMLRGNPLPPPTRATPTATPTATGTPHR